MQEKSYEIVTGTGRTDTVWEIKDQEMSDWIRDKGFLPYEDAYPVVGNYYGYDAFGEGSYIVYDKAFVENQIEEDYSR